MPYLIEPYGLSLDGSKLLLKDIDTQNVYNDKETATAQIAAKVAEQIEDNNQLIEWYTDQLQAQVMDENTEDRILREPKLYNYTFKVAKYSKAAIKRIP